MFHSPDEKRRSSDAESYTNTDADSVGAQIEAEKANAIKYRSVYIIRSIYPSLISLQELLMAKGMQPACRRTKLD